MPNTSGPFLRLLGERAFVVGGEKFSLPEKAYFLAALLVDARDHRMARRQAREVLWPGYDPVKAAQNLRQLLRRVGEVERQAGVTLIEHEGEEGLRLASDVSIDFLNFLRIDLQRAIKTGDFGPVRRALLDMPGPLLDGLDTEEGEAEEWLSEHRREMSEREAALLSALVDITGEDMDAGELRQLSERLLALDPIDEAGHRGLMRAHFKLGNPAAAARAYRTCLQVIAREMSGSPELRTDTLARSLGLIPQSANDDSADQRPRPTIGGRNAARGAPTIVVLPPVTVLADEAFSRVAKGLLEDVTVGLSQYRSFTVIAAHTGLELIARGVEAATLAAEQRFDYAVTFSLKPEIEGLAATCSLQVLPHCEVVWSKDKPLKMGQLSTAFGPLVRDIVSSIAIAVEGEEANRPVAIAEPTAYRLSLEGRLSLNGTSLEDLRRARRWFRGALKRSPDYAPAFAGIARTLTMEWLVRGMLNDDLLREAAVTARQAVRADPHDGRGYREVGFTSLYLKRHDESIQFFREATERNPNDADLLADHADALAHAGEPEAALSLWNRAMLLNPLAPDYYHWIGGSILYQLGRYEDAVVALDPVKDKPATARILAASCAMAGLTKRAQRYARTVRQLYPGFRTDDLWHIVPDRNRSDTEHLIDGLRRAGIR